MHAARRDPRSEPARRWWLWARGPRLYLRHEDDEPGNRRRITAEEARRRFPGLIERCVAAGVLPASWREA
jgi:hypothetical protein